MLIKRNQYLENIRRFYESNLIKVLILRSFFANDRILMMVKYDV